MGNKFFEYEEESDTLSIKKSGEEVEETINDRFICLFDLNKKKEIIGLEFLNFRKSFDIPLDVLRHIEDIDVLVRYNHKDKIVYLNVKLVYRKEKEKITIPVSMDLGNKDFVTRDFMAVSASV